MIEILIIQLKWLLPIDLKEVGEPHHGCPTAGFLTTAEFAVVFGQGQLEPAQLGIVRLRNALALWISTYKYKKKSN